MYKIELSKTSAKELEKIFKTNKSLYEKIILAFEILAENPHQGKALKATLKRYFSYRIGTYRIIYTFSNKKLLIVIVDIGHRKEIYRIY